MKRKGTILTREKALEFSSGVLTEEATSQLGDWSQLHPRFITKAEEEYFMNIDSARIEEFMSDKDPKMEHQYGVKEIDFTEAVKELEEKRAQLNIDDKFSYWRRLSPGSESWRGPTEHRGPSGRTPMFQRKLAQPRPGSFNYEDLTEEQAEKELGRVLQGIEENKFLGSMSIGPSEEQTKNLRTWIKVKKAQLYNKRK